MTKIIFTYPDYGTPCSYPELKKRTRQIVEVISTISPSELDGEEQMYLIKFSDGYIAEAFEDELVLVED